MTRYLYLTVALMIMSYPFHADHILDVIAGQVRDASSGAPVDAVHEKVVGELSKRLPVVVVAENRLKKL